MRIGSCRHEPHSHVPTRPNRLPPAITRLSSVNATVDHPAAVPGNVHTLPPVCESQTWITDTVQFSVPIFTPAPTRYLPSGENAIEKPDVADSWSVRRRSAFPAWMSTSQ